MTTFDERANALLRKVWSDLQNASREREVAAIRADPDRHRTTRIMSKGAHTGYTYFPAGKKRLNKKRRDDYRFCVSTHKNAADVFLIWRQVDRHKLVRGKWKWFEAQRYDFQWSPSKKEALGIARKKAARLKAECQDEAVCQVAARAAGSLRHAGPRNRLAHLGPPQTKGRASPNLPH